MALKSKATTCRAQSAYRKVQRAKPSFMFSKPGSAMMLPEEKHAYGKSNRPGTPVGDVISNYYGQKAEELIGSKYGYLQQAKKPLGLSYARGHTRASAMAHHATATSEWNKMAELSKKPDMFKMRKFQNIRPRTNTFNNRKSTVLATAKAAAEEAQEAI